MKKEKASWLFFQSWEKSIHLLSMEERGQLLTNLISYHKGEQISNNTPMLEMFWNTIEFNLDRNVARYTASVENGKKGGAPIGNQNASKQPKNNLTQPKNNLNDNDNDNDNDNVNGNENSNVNENSNGNNNVNENEKNYADTWESMKSIIINGVSSANNLS
jgi:cobalamin biosynthesis protein CobT